jgi:hypothetical protein
LGEDGNHRCSRPDSFPRKWIQAALNLLRGVRFDGFSCKKHIIENGVLLRGGRYNPGFNEILGVNIGIGVNPNEDGMSIELIKGYADNVGNGSRYTHRCCTDKMLEG